MTRRTTDLGDTAWHFGRVSRRSPDSSANDRSGVRDWLPATVPGNVRSDLLAQGRIEDPFFGTDNEGSQWVDDYDWWYKRPLDLELGDGERAFLCFEGIDYLSAVWLDEIELGRHEGMFSRQVYEITDLMSDGRSEIGVRIWGSSSLPKRQLEWWERLWAPIATLLDRGREPFPQRSATLKCQMSFGWDFAPRMRAMGLWDDVTLLVTRSAFVRDIFIATQPEGQQARVGVRATIDSDCEQAVVAEIRVKPPEVGGSGVQTWEFALSLDTRVQDARMEFLLPNPCLWQPWDRGAPSLYELELRITQGGQLLDSTTERFGIRSVQMSAQEGKNEGVWPLVISGNREFIRGANWVPLDALPGRLRRAYYERVIALAREAGINMVRVWGGGLREKKAFYDLCDEQGIMVWQDFPLACLLLGHFPRSEGFHHLLRHEATGIVRQLRNHPSLVLWCGGNEFSYRRNRRIVDTLREVVAAEDGTRPFRQTSPGRGDTHNWLVWHGKAPISEFERDDSPFISEFGLQSIPNVASLSRFLRPEDVSTPNEVWQYHCAQTEKLQRYVNPLSPNSWEEWVTASQKAQAYGLQVAIEHFRRHKYRTSGAMFWQLNDPWPAISWSVIDYYGQPKLAWERLRSFYGPILASLEFPPRRYRAGDVFRARVWAVNDLLATFPSCLMEVQLNGRPLYSTIVSLPPDSCEHVGSIESALENDAQELSVALWYEGRVLCSNEYDLSYYDPSHGKALDVLYHRIVQWLRE